MLPFDWATSSHLRPHPQLPKLKTKTRPDTNVSEADHQCPAESETFDQDEDPTKVSVTKDSFDVFVNMFSHTSANCGMISWNKVVAALVDAGFSATCIGGSGVVFKDERTNKGSIKLDRPHPENKVSPGLLRAMGVRFAKWFGWNEDTFVLRSSEQT